jgi:hypothetical protein
MRGKTRLYRKATALAGLALAISSLSALPAAMADPVVPPVWDVVVDDFESGTLDAWDQTSGGTFALVAGGGHNGSTGLSVAVGQSSNYLYQTGVAKAEQGYMTFWFNPNGVVIPDEGTTWVPGKSICLASIVNSEDWWPPMVALYVRRPAGQDYQAYLAWPIDASDGRFYDYESGGLPRERVGGSVAQWRIDAPCDERRSHRSLWRHHPIRQGQQQQQHTLRCVAFR